MEQKNSFIPIVLSIVFISLIIFVVYKYVATSPKEEEKKDDTSVVKVEEEKKEEVVVDPVVPEVKEEPKVVIDNGNLDFSTYVTTTMNIGDKDEDGMFSLDEIKKTADSSVYKFEFVLSPKDSAMDPYITATYIKSSGAIRVVLDRVNEDNSGIGYQKSLAINKDGVIKIYHNVSAKSTEELYDIGISKETPFYLEGREEDGKYIATLSVKYPGVVEMDIDLGSATFSTDSQEIVGANAAQGAKVTGYSYSASSGILKFIYKVGGSTSKPIPGVRVAKGNSGEIDLVFDSLASDTIAKNSQTISLPGNVKVYTQYSGGKSTYTFTNVNKEFKLYATTNPNEVVIEIKL